MPRPIRPDYKQTYLFPHSLEELILEDHPVRFIRACMDALDWEELGFHEGMGRRRYSANSLLRCVRYGYFHGIWSYGGLEVATQDHIGAIGLTGWQYQWGTLFRGAESGLRGYSRGVYG